MKKKVLYMIATPIGNLEDITIRALNTLKTLDILLCEDTRTTKILLDRYSINVPRKALHTHSSDIDYAKIMSLFDTYDTIGYCSDAGCPAISDPGNKLVSMCRSRLDIDIVPIGGVSALTNSVMVAGIQYHQFTFYGFLPHKKGRQTMLKKALQSDIPVVLYESVHRFTKLLEEIKTLSSSDKQLVVCKELTKIYEEVYYNTVDNCQIHFTKDKIKGEFVVIILPD